MVWVGGGGRQQEETRFCLLTAEPQSFRVSARAHPAGRFFSSSSFRYAALWVRRAGRPALCMHVPTTPRTSSPSSRGQPNVISRFHLTLSKGSCHSSRAHFHELEIWGVIAGFKRLLVHNLEATRCVDSGCLREFDPSRSRHVDATWEVSLCMIARPPKLDTILTNSMCDWCIVGAIRATTIQIMGSLAVRRQSKPPGRVSSWIACGP